MPLHRPARIALAPILASLVVAGVAMLAPVRVAAALPAPLRNAHANANANGASRQGPLGTKNAAGLRNTSVRGAMAHLANGAAPQRAPSSISLGSPTEGHLVGGARLGDAPYLRIFPVYAGADVRWGLEPLVSLIDRAGRAVRQQFPDAVLSVGHLSKAGGGELDHHASHESGRDADIGFYVKNQAGKPLLEDHMVPFVADGTAPTWPGARFDDARNWALVAAIVTDARARVTHLFVATPIRERLLAYAARIGAPYTVRVRASEVLAQPRGALPHDDHFHVRIACPSGMDRCVEQPTAHRRSLGNGAVASQGHAAPAHASPTAAPGAVAHALGAVGSPAAPPPAAKPPRAVAEDESARGESFVPTLAPIVPGLDSAVIAAPLGGGGVRSTWGTSSDPAPARAPGRPEPISDPDGILEGN